ncbi:MAG TPA: hypothetical protein VFG86_12965 [Chloroflexota bacterium]|jgi:hypothetical protein|nr:hypothetical protein [Chloroflexota bacterium]
MFEGTDRIYVRSVPATLVAFLLLLLLAVTTPTGTGDGIHDSVLLHPLFSHSHLIDGRIVSHEQMADVGSEPTASPTNGPALGAGAGASATAPMAVAISPTLPIAEPLFALPASTGHAAITTTMPNSVSFAPPHPPPTSGSATRP